MPIQIGRFPSGEPTARAPSGRPHHQAARRVSASRHRPWHAEARRAPAERRILRAQYPICDRVALRVAVDPHSRGAAGGCASAILPSSPIAAASDCWPAASRAICRPCSTRNAEMWSFAAVGAAAVRASVAGVGAFAAEQLVEAGAVAPAIRSAPFPPRMASSPPMPRRMSAPFRPISVFAALLAVNVSGP